MFFSYTISFFTFSTHMDGASWESEQTEREITISQSVTLENKHTKPKLTIIFLIHLEKSEFKTKS